MKPLAAVVICFATCAQADSFAERWPQPVASEPAAVTERVAEKPVVRAVRRARAQSRGFVCHRQTYYVGRHRYWRCKR